MTRAEYERLGNWCELLGPWEMLEEERMREESRIETFANNLRQGREALAELKETRLALKREQEAGLIQFAHYRNQYAAVVKIARALLTETSLTPSQVRERWPEDAGWLLERGRPVFCEKCGMSRSAECDELGH